MSGKFDFPSNHLCCECVFSDWTEHVSRDERFRAYHVVINCFCWKRYRNISKFILGCSEFISLLSPTVDGKKRVSNYGTYQHAKEECEKEMGKLQTKIAKEPEEGLTYIITKTEQSKAEGINAEGLRVHLTNIKDKSDIRTTTLWLREVAGENSKLGSFITAFKQYFETEKLIDQNNKPLEYDDTENWVNRKIKFLKWKNRERQVVIVG